MGELPGTGSSLPRAVSIRELGRLAVTPSVTGAITVQVSYHYGFKCDMRWRIRTRLHLHRRKSGGSLSISYTASTARYTTLQDAIDFAIAQFPENGPRRQSRSTRATPIRRPGTLALTVDLPGG